LITVKYIDDIDVPVASKCLRLPVWSIERCFSFVNMSKYNALFRYLQLFKRVDGATGNAVVWQVKVWFQNRRMKWKRTKGSQMARDKVTGQLKPVTTEPPAHLPEIEQRLLKDKPRLTWRHVTWRHAVAVVKDNDQTSVSSLYWQ